MIRNPLSNRKYVLAAIIVIITLVYVAQLFNLQVLNEDFRGYAERNAQLRRTIFPARGVIYDRNGRLLVFNQPTFDVMVITREKRNWELSDSLDFSNILNISIERFRELDAIMRDGRRNPGFSSVTPQLFMSRLGAEEYASLQENLHRFPGVFTRTRTERQYNYPHMGLVLGYVAEVNQSRINADPWFARGDFGGMTGVERSYEEVLRGEKGVEILLRDARGRVQGRFRDGEYDIMPIPGKDLMLSIDLDLQAYGELLMSNMVGSIVMIEPSTGEILALVSAPGYDPGLLTGRDFGTNFMSLSSNPFEPLNHRAVSGVYPPASTFKMPLGLIFLQEGIIRPQTRLACHGGFAPMGGRPRCHCFQTTDYRLSIAVSCNTFYCIGLSSMLGNRSRFTTQIEAYDVMRNYLLEMGFGRRLGVDLPSERAGFIPTSSFYTERLGPRWHAHNIISIALGQGEITATPLQIANFAAMVANRGYFYTPRVVRKIISENGEELTHGTRNTSGINREYWELTALGMGDAVTHGTAWRASLAPDIVVAGKTGTAENSRGDSHALFMGFAPLHNPQVAFAVIVEHGHFGGRTAAPIAQLMLQKFFNGEIREQDRWQEEQIINRVLLPPIYMRNLPIEERDVNLWVQSVRR